VLPKLGKVTLSMNGVAAHLRAQHQQGGQRRLDKKDWGQRSICLDVVLRCGQYATQEGFG
jgi:hypothetical protein